MLPDELTKNIKNIQRSQNKTNTKVILAFLGILIVGIVTIVQTENDITMMCIKVALLLGAIGFISWIASMFDKKADDESAGAKRLRKFEEKYRAFAIDGKISPEEERELEREMKRLHITHKEKETIRAKLRAEKHSDKGFSLENTKFNIEEVIDLSEKKGKSPSGRRYRRILVIRIKKVPTRKGKRRKNKRDIRQKV